MIRNSADKKTGKIFSGKRIKTFLGFKKIAERKLVMLDNAEKLVDLLALHGNQLDKLGGNRKGSTELWLMISGVFVLFGKMTVRMTWKYQTITS